MNPSFSKLLRQKRQIGDIAPQPHGGGAEAKLNKDHLMILTDLVAEFPDATLDELRQLIKKRTRVDVSIPTVWRACEALGLPRKKNYPGRGSRSGCHELVSWSLTFRATVAANVKLHETSSWHLKSNGRML
jgi:transposase